LSNDVYEKANDSKKYTNAEEDIWKYCMDIWEYYDELEGEYSGDKYTENVFNDAGKKFGISDNEAEKIWDKVDKAKLGSN
jgi:predicted Zn-dependent protease with MMP-like domain